ncbi:hypothetical protein [Goodfellowiella coeruleoviolacea]|uniref:Uncharacterized protein n=1 Tax=Goodfellowiella coeruleoviolacea TaxID=334858 RepID=A0AAE3GIF8_9PSEU|nr:hypothetical protein [Goodfellowiella coeruleoviolacea]MCP2167939.1 hypothetical protein [Goodfellowiella coeruleoviolacea]
MLGQDTETQAVLIAFAGGEDVTPHVVWVDPDARMPERVEYGAA